MKKVISIFFKMTVPVLIVAILNVIPNINTIMNAANKYMVLNALAPNYIPNNPHILMRFHFPILMDYDVFVTKDNHLVLTNRAERTIMYVKKLSSTEMETLQERAEKIYSGDDRFSASSRKERAIMLSIEDRHISFFYTYGYARDTNIIYLTYEVFNMIDEEELSDLSALYLFKALKNDNSIWDHLDRGAEIESD